MPNNNSDFTPLLSTTNWAEEWKQLQIARNRNNNASHWDERSKKLVTKTKRSDYPEAFIRLAKLLPGDSVLDMGCGNGAIALPVANAGHKVIAADFSEGMLARLNADIEAKHITGIKPLKMSWSDNWEAFGVFPKSVDVALASRSIATSDLKDALMRLDAVAKRRVCITLSTGNSPRTDENVMEALGLANFIGRDYWYALNILISEGIRPELNYISSVRRDSFKDFDEAFLKYDDMLERLGNLLPDERLLQAKKDLKQWLSSQLIDNPKMGESSAEKPYVLKTPSVVRWAFISWNTSEQYAQPLNQPVSV